MFATVQAGAKNFFFSSSFSLKLEAFFFFFCNSLRERERCQKKVLKKMVMGFSDVLCLNVLTSLKRESDLSVTWWLVCVCVRAHVHTL